MREADEKIVRLYRWHKGEAQAPVRIELHPTNRCNLKCIFCWQINADTNSYGKELSDQKLIEIVRHAAHIGVKEWIISGGGEPLVRKSISARIFEEIKRGGMWGQLTTNGVLLTDDIAKLLVHIGWDQVQFSVDTWDAKLHDRLRQGKGSFNKIMQNISNLVAIREKHGAGKLPKIGLNTILHRRLLYPVQANREYSKTLTPALSQGESEQGLVKMIELGAKLGIDLVFFEPIYPGYLKQDDLSLKPEDTELLNRSIDKAAKRADELGMETNVLNFKGRADLVDKGCFSTVVDRESEDREISLLNAPCFQPWYLMGIKGDGLAGCCSTFNKGVYLHDKTLEEVWFGDYFNRIREDMIQRRLPDYCDQCSVVVVLDNKQLRAKLKDLAAKMDKEASDEGDIECADKLETLHEAVKRKEEYVKSLERSLAEKKEELKNLREIKRRLDRLRKTKSWRVYQRLKSIVK